MSVLSVLIVMMLGWASASVALVSPTPDACSMQCCVKQKHCCCTPRHSSVKEQNLDGKEKLDRDRIESRCPEGCLAIKVLNSFSMRDLACAPVNDGCLDKSTDLHSRCANLYLKLRVFGQSSPRGPPVLFEIRMSESQS
ncbi:MAG: hypothetical protein WBV94_00110 [Blastocatellia bacterium]